MRPKPISCETLCLAVVLTNIPIAIAMQSMERRLILQPEPERPSPVTPRSDYVILALGLLFLLLLLSSRGSFDILSYRGTLQQASLTLRGQVPFSDLAQDVVGFRALVERRDAYPILGPAMRSLGIDWNVRHASTHPPTAYLLVAPVAYLSWSWASALWAWLMLGLLYLSFRSLGLRPLVALGLTPLAVLWPPVATSLGQMTLVWLFGITAAYAWARERPFASGIALGLAAMTKLFPGLLIILFLRNRLWRGVLGLVAVGVVSLLVLVWLSPAFLSQYAGVNESNSLATILRQDNSSLPASAFRAAGWPGVIGVLLFLSLVISANRDCLASWRESEPSLKLWMLGFYLTVVLLPIAWIYSVAPLLPVILFLLRQEGRAAQVAGLAALAIPFAATPWGVNSVAPLVTVHVAVGVGLILVGRPLRFPLAGSFKGLFGGTEDCVDPNPRA